MPLPPRCAAYEGYNLHANVGLDAGEREGLERLCRYLLRPPVARDRLTRADPVAFKAEAHLHGPYLAYQPRWLPPGTDDDHVGRIAALDRDFYFLHTARVRFG